MENAQQPDTRIAHLLKFQSKNMESGNGIITTGTRIAVVVIPYHRMKTNMESIATSQISAQTAERRWMVIPMYDELVKQLRECTAEMNGEKTLWHQAADVIEELQKDLERSKDFEAFWQHEAEEALKKFQVAISNKPRWIPVTERLPEDRKMVLATIDGVVRIAFYGNYMWEEVETYSIFYPTHWMPIPQVPESEGE